MQIDAVPRELTHCESHERCRCRMSNEGRQAALLLSASSKEDTKTSQNTTASDWNEGTYNPVWNLVTGFFFSLVSRFTCSTTAQQPSLEQKSKRLSEKRPLPFRFRLFDFQNTVSMCFREACGSISRRLLTGPPGRQLVLGGSTISGFTAFEDIQSTSTSQKPWQATEIEGRRICL